MKNDAKTPGGRNGVKTGNGEDNGNRRNWTPFLVGGILGLVLVIFGITHCWFGHKWNAATCTAPQTCYACGKTQGSALGHSFAPATETKPKTCTVCGRTEGDVLVHTHSWAAATCTTPQYCTDCGETVGTEMGHYWIDATCQNPKYCENCGETVGTSADHLWAGATYDAPKTCTRCGAEEGRSLGYPLIWCREVENSNHPKQVTRWDVEVGTWKDCFGESRSDVIKFWVNANMVNTEHTVYELGGDYSELDLTVVNAQINAEDGRNRITVYADGTLLYQSGWIGNDSRPVETTLDVRGISMLRIECDTQTKGDCYCLVYGVLFR